MIHIKDTKINLHNVDYARIVAPHTERLRANHTIEVKKWRLYVKFKGGSECDFWYEDESDCNADFIKL